MFPSLQLIAQQSNPPQFDSMFWVLLFSRVCHILGAIILIGGVFYIRTIISPTSTAPGTAPVDQLFGGRRAAWAKWVGIATGLLIFSGFFNFYMIMKQNERMAWSYNMIFGLKFIAAVVVFALAALLAGRTSIAEALRQKWRMWLGVCLAVSILTVALGSVLKSYPRTKKADAITAPQPIAPANTPG